MFAIILSYLSIYNIIAIRYDDYNQSVALTALHYAYATFCASDLLTNWDCKWCQELPEFSIHSVIEGESSGTLAYTGYNSKNKQVIIAFRGTINLKNWMTDFDWGQILLNNSYNTEGGNWAIHKGFWTAIHDLLNSGLYTSIQKLFTQHKASNILLAGHSLGAAMSQVLGLMLTIDPIFSEIPIGDVHLINFGSPRWASKDIATYFDTIQHTNWRIVNKYDVIPHTPTQNTGYYGYYHTTDEIEYTDYEALEYQLCEGDGEESSNCGYAAVLSKQYHLNYLNVLEDRCGTRKSWCVWRRSLGDVDNRSNCSGDSFFPEIRNDSVYIHGEEQSTENGQWILVVGIAVGCLSVLIFCGLLVMKMYQTKGEKTDEQENYQEIVNDI